MAEISSPILLEIFLSNFSLNLTCFLSLHIIVRSTLHSIIIVHSSTSNQKFKPTMSLDCLFHQGITIAMFNGLTP
jgi:hypothetical protein